MVVWLATLLLRRNQARLRYGLWLAASVKFLIPFSLLVGLGSLLPKPQHVVVAMPISYAMDTVAQPFTQTPMDFAPVVVQASPMQRFAHMIPLALGIIWLCGVMVVLAIWGVRWRQVAKTLRRAVRVEDGREWENLRRLQKALGAGRQIPLLMSQKLMEPGMFGIFQPVLIWPERLSERLDDEHIEAILAHELVHAQRKDNLAATLHMVVEAAFWFYPLVWWMERRMVEERERACDEAVVEMGSRPGIYAESLLKSLPVLRGVAAGVRVWNYGCGPGDASAEDHDATVGKNGHGQKSGAGVVWDYCDRHTNPAGSSEEGAEGDGCGAAIYTGKRSDGDTVRC